MSIADKEFIICLLQHRIIDLLPRLNDIVPLKSKRHLAHFYHLAMSHCSHHLIGYTPHLTHLVR